MYSQVPAISKEDQIPLDLPLCLQSFTISYFELGYFEFPAISRSLFFPQTLINPIISNLSKTEYVQNENEDEQQEETLKGPKKSDLRQAIETLSYYSLLLREPRFNGKQASCHSRSTKVFEKNKNNRTFKDFSMQQHLLIYPTYNYCIFI